MDNTIGRRRGAIAQFVCDPAGQLPHEGTIAALQELHRASIRYDEDHPDHPDLCGVNLPSHLEVVVRERDDTMAELRESRKRWWGKRKIITLIVCEVHGDTLLWFVRSPNAPRAPKRKQRDRSGGSRPHGRGDGTWLEDFIDAIIDACTFGK